jgi:arginine repressor
MVLQKETLAKALREKMGKRNQVDYAAWLTSRGVEVHQATISRLLTGRCKTATPKVKNICIHAGIKWKTHVRREQPRKNPRLMHALGQVWDGSPAHADWLARVIKTAGAAPS